MRSRRNRPLFVIDIALPRDVETAVGDLEQVFLYHMDDLQSIVSENLARREHRTGERRSDRQRGSRAVCVVAAVARDRADDRRPAAALREHPPGRARRLEPKLGGLTPEARARVDEVTRLLVEKLLLTPTEQLKTVGDDTLVVAYAEALHRLFTLAPGAKSATKSPRIATSRSSPERGAVERRHERSGSPRAAAGSPCGRRTPSPIGCARPAHGPRSSSSRRPAIGRSTHPCPATTASASS